MKKLTAEKCKKVIEGFKWMAAEGPGMLIRDEYDIQAYEIALPILKQQERGESSKAEESIGVWNPITKEIAVNHDSGIKVVELAHWHCHCTMEVIVREMPSHPLVKSRKERGEGEWIEFTGGDKPISGSVMVEVRFKRSQFLRKAKVGQLDWTHYGNISDIIAYRIIPERATNQNGESL